MDKLGNTVIHEIGDIVKYKNRPHLVVYEDFNYGGIVHELGLVKLETSNPVLLKVRYTDEHGIEDYDEESLLEIRRGI